MTVAARPSGLPVPAAGYCPRWRQKLVYWSADQASLGLREFWSRLLTRGRTIHAERIRVYPCSAGNFTHWHLGKEARNS